MIRYLSVKLVYMAKYTLENVLAHNSSVIQNFVSNSSCMSTAQLICRRYGYR